MNSCLLVLPLCSRHDYNRIVNGRVSIGNPGIGYCNAVRLRVRSGDSLTSHLHFPGTNLSYLLSISITRNLYPSERLYLGIVTYRIYIQRFDVAYTLHTITDMYSITLLVQ